MIGADLTASPSGRDSISVRFAPAMFASVILGFVIATRPLSPVPRGIAITAIALSWAASIFLRRRDVRAHASAVSAIAGVISAGQTDIGPIYGVACALFLLTCLRSMRTARSAPSMARAPESSSATQRQSARGIIVIVLTTVAVTAAFLTLLPPLARRAEARFNTWGGGAEQTAFSTSMVLGSTRGMLQSDVVVMHIDLPEGDHAPEYLRGAVYDDYDGRHWRTTMNGRTRKSVAANGAPNKSETRITLVRGVPNGEDMRWFLPPGACDIITPAARVDIDAFGVARRGPGGDPPTLSYGTSACRTPPATVAPPAEVDLIVDDEVKRVLEPLAAQWVNGMVTDQQKLAAIDIQLQRFQYSLSVTRNKKIDPIVDFVTLHRAGHCEMFASAMVLMARTQGIPARVIGGYHVSEVNPLTGRAVVRDRHAHAWVEAWVDGQWRTYDPTPGSEANRKHAGIIDHVGDYISSLFERIAIAMNKLGLLGTAAVLGVFVGVLLAIRWLAQKLRTRRRRRLYSTSIGAPPLPCFDSLSDALTRAGHERAESEPVEAFARKLGKIERPWARAASSALLHYARLRYGNIGEEDEVIRDVDRAARSVRAAARD